MSGIISQALAGLAQAIKDAPALAVDDALALAAFIPALHQTLLCPGPAAGPAPHYLDDPRYALALATAAEASTYQALRTQIYAAHLVEDTAAHTLAQDELTAARQGAADFSVPAQRTGKRPSFTGPAALLASWLRTDHFEAKRRLQAAGHVFAQYDYQHLRHRAQFPLLAMRFADLRQPPAEVLSAARRLSALEPKRDEYAAPATASALTEDGELLESIVDQQLDEPDPGTRRQLVNSFLKSQKERLGKKRPEAQEGLYRRGERDGLVHYDLALRPARAELFESGISQSDNPRSGAGQAAREAFAEPPGSRPEQDAASGTFYQAGTGRHPDFLTDEEAAASEDPVSAPLSAAARRLNGLMNLLEINTRRLQELLHAARNGGTPTSAVGTDPGTVEVPTITPQIVVMLTLDELEGRARTHGITQHGFKLDAADLRQTLARARIIPMVLGGRGELLDIGRSQRKHPSYMRLGVAVRDRGCIVPGCTMDPERCNIHHIWFWSEGGVTAVYWSAMLCDTHHHDVHAGLIKVIPDDGVPKVILPSFIDPTQTPVRNSYHMAKAA
ncbi:HNH endonuclease signature motif containing protein [Glutamicibacter sp.]|uniref:HNH endonuclease signature motif containing protein n=1 Tax=Glutamicibacter sp. TaxID=1931995 RepID=UPI003D6BA1DA